MDKNDPRFRGMSISTGAVRYSDLGYLLTRLDEVVQDGYSDSMLLVRDQGEWGAVAFKWTGCSGTVCHEPNERFLALGVEGSVYAMGGGNMKHEDGVSLGGVDPRQRGPLREIRGIAKGRAYAVGACRQAYVRESEGQWRCIDASAQGGERDITDTCFESIDGFSEQEIYTVGWEGEIWLYDGSQFSQQPSPTELALHKVRCAPDGYAYACGQLGTLLRGRAGQWEVIARGSATEDLWGLEIYNGQVYVSSLRAVYRLEAGELKIVDFGDEVPGTYHHLSAADGILWSIGAKDVMEFNGVEWKPVLQIA